MLKIAAIGNTYWDARRFIEYRYHDNILSINNALGVYTLKDGNEIYPCYGESEKYLSLIFDAFVVAPSHQGDCLIKTIQKRCERRR